MSAKVARLGPDLRLKSDNLHVTDVRIALVTAPSGDIALSEEIRLVKPALLYADHVTLYSPVAALLQSAATVGMRPELTLQVAREVGPLIDPEYSVAMAKYDALMAKKHKTRDDIRLLIGFRRIVKDAARDIAAKVEELVDEAGGTELLPAIEAGLVTIDPLVREDSLDSDDVIFTGFMQRLQELLREGHSYPLLDDQIGGLVHAAVTEMAFEIGRLPTQHGKEASAAARVMETLPAFPNATIQDILDIRDELRGPLIRFRTALIEMERLIVSAAYEPDFPAEVDRLYREKIAPALLEINELVAGNTWLRQLVGATVADAKTMLSAIMTVGVTSTTDLPHLVAAALDVAVPLTAAAAQAARTKKLQDQEVQRHQLFFLHKTNVLLESRAAA